MQAIRPTCSVLSVTNWQRAAKDKKKKSTKDLKKKAMELVKKK
jgi:hypothetical protein